MPGNTKLGSLPQASNPTTSDGLYGLQNSSSTDVRFTTPSLITLFLNNLVGGTELSTQLKTYTNSGTAAGTFYYINLGGIKLLWGQTASQNTGSSYGINFPGSFFNTIQTGLLTVAFASGTSAAFVNGNGTASTTAWTFNLGASTGSGTMSVFALVIGT